MRDDTDNQDIVLIHDGVRPLITDELFEANMAFEHEKSGF